MLQFYENADNVILNQPLGTRLSLSLPSFFDDQPAPSSHAHFLHIYRNGTSLLSNLLNAELRKLAKRDNDMKSEALDTVSLQRYHSYTNTFATKTENFYISTKRTGWWMPG